MSYKVKLAYYWHLYHAGAFDEIERLVAIDDDYRNMYYKELENNINTRR